MIDINTVLLAVLVVLVAARLYQAHVQHRENGELFSAFATMVGEWFQMWREHDDG